MGKEIVVLPDDNELVTELLYGSKNDDWKYIETKQTGVDLDKGVEYSRVILERISDNRLFAFEFSSTNYHSIKEINDWPIKGTEVFKVIKEVVFYE